MARSKKIWRKIHLWLGVISSPIVFILGITGCILAFDEELEAHFNRRSIDSGGKTEMQLGQLIQTAQATWTKEKKITVIEIPNVADRPWRFRSFQEGDDSGIWYWNEKAYYESLFVNPYTAQVIAHENSEFDFFRVVLYLHWSLLFKTSIGQPIVGVATLLYLLSLITGIYLWWPNNKKNVNKRLRFKWKASTGIKRKIYDLHNILGFYILSIGILLALTGMVWAFPSVGALIQNGLDAQSVKKTASIDKPRVEQATDPYGKILEYMRKNYPNASGYIFYNTTITSDHRISALVRYEKAFKDVIVLADIRSGEVHSTIGFNDKTAGQQFREWNYDIHVGRALGIWGKMLVFIASLVSASLPLTGMLIWFNRDKGKTIRRPFYRRKKRASLNAGTRGEK